LITSFDSERGKRISAPKGGGEGRIRGPGEKVRLFAEIREPAENSFLLEASAAGEGRIQPQL